MRVNAKIKYTMCQEGIQGKRGGGELCLAFPFLTLSSSEQEEMLQSE